MITGAEISLRHRKTKVALKWNTGLNNTDVYFRSTHTSDGTRMGLIPATAQKKQ